MKNLILILFFAMAPVYCQAIEMPQQAKEIGCPNCHSIDHKVVGPAWMDVSKRYRSQRNDPEFVKTLIKKVSRGGAGNWGDVPMVANDPTGNKHDQIAYLVKFVLSLSDRLPQYRNQK
jgi:cytochrome c